MSTITKSDLSHVLLPGKQNGQTAETLAAALGIAPADVPALVNALQRSGYLVVEDNGRYFLADTLDEWREYRDHCFMAAAVDLAQRHRAMTRSAAHRWPRQWPTFGAVVIGEVA